MRHIRLILLGSVAASALTPACAAAQNRTDNYDADSIVVTARRIQERLQDVPISITVFNQEQLSNRNVVNAGDLATFTPSLSVDTNFGSDNTTFSLRGFTQDIGTAPSVGVYFGDVVAPRGGSSSASGGDGAGPGTFFDLQNVQVLKGPQGTLFGRNTTGGAILLVPQKPTDRLEGFVEGSIGNYDMRRIQAVINIPLADTFRVRLGVDHMTRDGYLKNISGIGPSAYNDIDYTAFRGSIVADLTPDLENYTIASFLSSDNNGGSGKVIACDPNPSGANLLGPFACAQIAAQADQGFYTVQNDNPLSRSKIRQWQIINTTTWQVSDNVSVKNIISYAEFQDYLDSNLFGTSFLAAPGVRVGFANIRPITNGYTANQSTFTEEFRVQGNSPDNRLTWQIGGYLELSDPLSFVGSQSPNLLNCIDSSTFQCTDVLGIGLSQLLQTEIHVGSINYTVARTKYRNSGVYAQATYAFTETLKATGGIRYTWDKQSSESKLISYALPTFPVPVGPPIPRCSRFNTTLPDCGLILSQKSSAPTWMIDLEYSPSRDMLLYGKYSRGYRAGGIKFDAPVQYNTFEPEKVDTYELGLKTTFASAIKGTFNLAAFYNDFSNQQLRFGFQQNPASPIRISPTVGPVNAGSSRIYGLEADLSISPFQGFRIEGSYAYLNTRVLSVATVTLPVDDPFQPSPPVEAGDPLVLSPKNKFTITASYTLPLDEALGRLSVGATLTHSDSQVSNYSYKFPALTNGVDIGRLPGYDLLNLNMNWLSVAGSPVDFSLFVTNLTKEKFFTRIPGIYAGAGFETAYLNEPRMIGARLKYNFGDWRP